MWRSFCLTRFGKRLLSQYIENKRPHQLANFNFDIKSESNNATLDGCESEIVSLSSETNWSDQSSMNDGKFNQDDEHLINTHQQTNWKMYRKDFCGLIRLSRSMFLSFLTDIQTLPSNRPKILLVDRETSLLLIRMVHWLELKKAGIACVFVLGEQPVSDLLTNSCDVIYLLATARRDSNELKFLAQELQQRSHMQLHLYVCGPCDLHDSFEKKQLQLLSQLGQCKCKMLELWPVVAERVALIDNAIENIRFLTYFVRFPCERDLLKNNGPVATHLQALAHKLAHLLDTCGILPYVRYQNTFHGLSKWLAKMTFDRLIEKRKQNPVLESVNKNLEQDYLLLIVDRTVDLITPLLHATLFREFVTQELETIYDTNNRWVDEQLADIELNQVTNQLINISKKLMNNYMTSLMKNKKEQNTNGNLITNQDNWTEADLESRSNAIQKHFESAEQLKKKFQCGYNMMCCFEQQLIKNMKISNQNSNHVNNNVTNNNELVNIQKLTFEQVFELIINTNQSGNFNLDKFDLIRFATINLLLNKKAKRKNLKRFVGKKHKLNKKICNKMNTYVSLVQKIANKNYIFLKNEINQKAQTEPIEPVITEIKTNEKPKSKEKKNVRTDVNQIPFKSDHLYFSLEQILQEFSSNKLDDNLFPFLTNSSNSATKLILFVLGGIGYNELHLPRKFGNKLDVLLVSDTLIFPRLLFETMISN